MTDQRQLAFARQSDAFLPWAVLVAGAVASTMLLFAAGGDIGIKVVAMLLLVAGAAASVRFDVAHPYVWLGGTFTLYSISGPLLAHLGIHPYRFWGGWPVEELDFNRTIELEFLALLIVFLVIGPRRVSFEASRTDRQLQAFTGGANIVMALAAVIGLVTIVEILGQGFATKGDYTLHGGWVTRMSFGFNVMATASAVFIAKQFSEGKPKAAFLTIGVLILFGLLLVALIGQRHFLFRVGIVIVFTVHIFHRPFSLRALFLMALGAMILGTTLNGLKMAVTAREAGLIDEGQSWLDLLTIVETHSSGLENESDFYRYFKYLAAAALGGELMAASNNLAMILARIPQDLPHFYGETIPLDLARAVLPGFIVAPSVETTADVYNRMLFPKTHAVGGGVGFSIVGYGFLHFGLAGVFLIMALLGGAIGAIYRWAGRSSMGLMFLIGFIPVGVYSARNDISGPLSQGTKHVLLPLVLMMIISVLRGWRPRVADRRISAERRAAMSAPSRIASRERRRENLDRRSRESRRQGPRTSRADRGRFDDITEPDPP